jgi:hypothetical protein
MSRLERLMAYVGIESHKGQGEYRPEKTQLHLRGHHIPSLAMELHGTPWTQPKFGETNLLEIYTRDPDARITIVAGVPDSICGVCAEIDDCKRRRPAVKFFENLNDTGVALGFGLIPGATYPARELLEQWEGMDKVEILLRSLKYSMITMTLSIPLMIGIIATDEKNPGWYEGKEIK